MRRAGIVVTTIFEPRFLAGYLASIERWGRRESVSLTVVPDRKTPPSVGEACARARESGFRVRCPDLLEQHDFLRRLGADPGWIPCDSDNRRNVGFLMELAEGADVVISIDDDNFCEEGADFVGSHLAAGTLREEEIRETSDGWLNVCESLRFERGAAYPRGFPYAAREAARTETRRRGAVRVAANAGLWTDDPDVDAVTRLGAAPRVASWRGEPFVLGPGTLSPLNTQNTAVSREAMEAYYYVRMGEPIQGLTIDRYGDILSGYFLQACARHLGEAVRFGDPVCRHLRTPHDLFKDLYHELAGMVLVEELAPWLREAPLSGSTYAEAYESLAAALEQQAERFRGFVWDQGGREFLRETAGHMRTWLRCVRVISGSVPVG